MFSKKLIASVALLILAGCQEESEMGSMLRDLRSMDLSPYFSDSYLVKRDKGDFRNESPYIVSGDERLVVSDGPHRYVFKTAGKSLFYFAQSTGLSGGYQFYGPFEWSAEEEKIYYGGTMREPLGSKLQ